jgi:hypothetical protein
MRSIVLLRLGGVHVAEFAHRSLVLPSLTTICCNTVLPSLVVSPSIPLLADVENNILSCFSAFNSARGSDPPLSDTNHTIVHQVLMLDELAVEKHVRWDDSCNKFQGMCREHNSKIPLEFMSERELELLCEALEKNQVHLASEVCGT